MNDDQTFRLALLTIVALELPIAVYHRLRSQSSREPLDAAALFVAGIALLAANWFFLLAGAAVIALLVRRTRTEEANLLARFGAPYQAYLDRTGRFLPKA